jgi:hypothetical protein
VAIIAFLPGKPKIFSSFILHLSSFSSAPSSIKFMLYLPLNKRISLMPYLSKVIPAYNEETRIGKTLEGTFD